jgi:hypothetical protein
MILYQFKEMKKMFPNYNQKRFEELNNKINNKVYHSLSLLEFREYLDLKDSKQIFLNR